MAQHGYLREYDEGWDRGDDRDRDWRDRERGWRGERDFRDRDREFMFGSNERSERDRRMSDHGSEVRGDWKRAPRDFGSGQDEHYLSWRDKQVEALDRDYAEYCREREQQFHQDFDSWRRQRRANPQPLQAGMTQSSQSQESADTLELTPQAQTSDPMAAATLGTNSSRTGRR